MATHLDPENVSDELTARHQAKWAVIRYFALVIPQTTRRCRQFATSLVSLA